MESPGVLLRRHGLRPKHAWGQNFLADPDVQERIAGLVDPRPGDTVVELGSGLGHLTARLVGKGAKVIAVERDRDLAPVLREEIGANHPELEVVEADAMSLDLAALAKAAGGRVKVCGNLPYHIGSQIIFNVLDQWTSVARLVVMLQREVVDRIVSAPDTEDYGLLSVLLQEIADVELGLKVPPGAFVPPPAVDSAVLVCRMLDKPRGEVTDMLKFRKIVKASFSQRRKTLSNALKPVASKDALTNAFAVTGIDPRRRGETLSVAEFASLERALSGSMTAAG